MKNQDHQKSSKIVYFGTSDFAVPALIYLIQNGYEVAGVVTQPEKPVGRARVIMPSPVKKIAIEHNITVWEPHNLKSDDNFFENFRKLSPDLCIVAAYGKIIPSRYLDVPVRGFINIHPSLLPKYRGPSPIQSAIANGDSETGVAVMLINEKVDSGPLIAEVRYSMPKDKFYKEIEKELSEIGGELLISTLPGYLSGDIKLREQDNASATFTKILTREDGQIDWNKDAEQIFNQIRALTPEPGVWTRWNNKILNIKKAEVTCTPDADLPVGTVFKKGDFIAVATKKCYLILKQIQLEGGKEMDARSFLNGHPDFLNSKLG